MDTATPGQSLYSLNRWRSVLDAEADAWWVDDVQPINLGQGRLEGRLDRQVSHDHEWDNSVGRVIARVMLDHAGDADSPRAEGLGQQTDRAGAIRN
jgi:hypothetical protein